jgi:hypothetical protein
MFRITDSQLPKTGRVLHEIFCRYIWYVYVRLVRFDTFWYVLIRFGTSVCRVGFIFDMKLSLEGNLDKIPVRDRLIIVILIFIRKAERKDTRAA